MSENFSREEQEYEEEQRQREMSILIPDIISDFESITEGVMLEQQIKDTSVQQDKIRYAINEELSLLDSDFNTRYKEWLDSFHNYVWGNDTYVQMLFHVYLGQLFKYIKIKKLGVVLDGRFSLFLIQPSGTAKNTPLTLFHRYCANENIHIRYKLLDKFTDFGLFGGSNTLTWVKNGRVVKDTDLVDGIFSKTRSDIIVSKEASVILEAKRNSINSDVVKHINNALDSIHMKQNRVSIDLKNASFECESEASVVFTSYPSPVDIDTLQSGIFRRIPTFYNQMKTNDMFDNTITGLQNIANAQHAELVGNSELLEENYKINRFSMIMREYRNIISKEGRSAEMFVHPDAIFLVTKFIEDYRKKTYALSNYQTHIFYSIFDSYVNHMMVVASHHAILDKKIIVEENDMRYATDMFIPILANIEKYIKFIFENKKDEHIKSIRNIETKKRIINIICNSVQQRITADDFKTTEGVSRASAYRILNMYVDDGFLIKRGKYIYLSQNYDKYMRYEDDEREN